jgi:hypothetical protein
MGDKFYAVRIAAWRKSDIRKTAVRANSLAAAKRVTNRLYGTLGVTLYPKPIGRAVYSKPAKPITKADLAELNAGFSNPPKIIKV